MSQPAEDPVIKRSDLQKLLGVHSDTMRLWIKKKKLPPLDVNLSRVTKGWRRSTLLAAGVNV